MGNNPDGFMPERCFIQGDAGRRQQADDAKQVHEGIELKISELAELFTIIHRIFTNWNNRISSWSDHSHDGENCRFPGLFDWIGDDKGSDASGNQFIAGYQ